MASLPESPDIDDELGFDLLDQTPKLRILRPIGGLDDLCKTTKFTRQEIRIMYRGFKQESNVPKFLDIIPREEQSTNSGSE